MVVKIETLTEAGVTTPLSLPVDTNGRDIKNAKVIKDSRYKIQKPKVNYVAGILGTKNLLISGLKSGY
jgi:hypothetical protein